MVNLNVLSCGQMVFAGAVFIAYIENGAELIEREEAHGNLDANHLNSGLTLSVHPPRQSETPEAFFIELPLLVEQNASIQVKNVPLDDGVIDFIDEAEHEIVVVMSVFWE